MAKPRPTKKPPTEPARPAPTRPSINFEPGNTYETRESVITAVQAPIPLPVGTHVFELEVVDDAGNVSAPDRVRVVVKDSTLPTAVLEAPESVEPGKSFRLDGSKSSDVPPGEVVTYRWTLLAPRATP